MNDERILLKENFQWKNSFLIPSIIMYILMTIILIILICNQIYHLLILKELFAIIGLSILLIFLSIEYIMLSWFLNKQIIITKYSLIFYSRKLLIPWIYEPDIWNLNNIYYFYINDKGIMLIEKEIYKYYQIPLSSVVKDRNNIVQRICVVFENIGKKKISQEDHFKWIEDKKKESIDMKRYVEHYIATNELNRPQG